MNQATKQELEIKNHNLGPVVAKCIAAEPRVVHSRDASTAAAAARVAARYAQLPSYSSLNPDWRTGNPDTHTKIHHPIKRASAISNQLQSVAPKSPALADVKPLAWFTKVEETKVARRSPRHKGSNQSVSPNSVEEAGVQMNADVIEAAGSVSDWTSSTINQFPLHIADSSSELHKARTNSADASTGVQLNIFEVDPGVLTIAPVPAAVQSVELHQTMLLDFEPQLDLEPQPAFEPKFVAPISPAPNAAATDCIEHDSQIQPTVIEFQESATSAIPQSATPQSAPWSRRTMAGLVDFALVLSSFAALTLAAARFAPDAVTAHPSIKLGVLVFVALSALYHTFFTLLFRETPGARFAELSMSNFESVKPTERQMGLRLLLLPISILPAGLGVLWALFDPNSLCLHDRLSRTCLRYQY